MNKLLSAVLLLTAIRVMAQPFTVTPSSTTYSANGGEITFTVAMSYPANVAAVSFSAKPPGATWAHVSTGGTNVPHVSPKPRTTTPVYSGDTTDPTDANSKWGWAYQDVPAGSASFTFTVEYPANLTGTQTIVFGGDYRLNNVVTPVTVQELVLNSPPRITTHPADASTMAGQDAIFTVAAAGGPTPTLKWQTSMNNGANWSIVNDGASFTGTTTGTLTVKAAPLAMSGHKFRAVATNGVLPDATSNVATLQITSAPEVVLQPRTQAVATGATLRLTTAASGNPAPSYQWKKGDVNVVDDTRISGATTATLTITNVQATDAGSYTVVATNGISSAATSAAAVITLAPAGYGATHTLAGVGYVAGGTLTINNTVTFQGEISSLGYAVTLPTGWTYASSSGSVQSTPQGSVGTLTWAWSNIAGLTSPVTFSYTLNAPADASGTYFFPATAIIANGNADQFPIAPSPDPLLVGPVLYHTADTNGDFKINLSELLRIISYYNTRFTNLDNTKVQTGAYKLQSGTPDGFAPDATRSAAPAAGQGGLSVYHSADVDRNGAINLSELLRVISYYNTRFANPDDTKVQTGAYKVQGGTPDGYAPDATRVP